jgi:pimeloyl-ACP methyl ester carboxylesterase
MGGMVAMRFALRHPQRLKSLILMDTAAEPLTIFPQALREQLAKEVRANGCASRVKMMREMPVGDAQQRGVDFLGSDEHWRRIELKLSQMDPEAWVALGDDMSKQSSLLPDSGWESTTIIVGQHDDPL